MYPLLPAAERFVPLKCATIVKATSLPRAGFASERAIGFGTSSTVAAADLKPMAGQGILAGAED